MQHLRANTQIVHEEQILEAIDQLRRRKARPDADRICNYLLRKFSVDARDTIADLHQLIEAEKVIQVDYKGNTSYRNASKWSRLQLYKNRPEGFVKERLNSAMVAGAVAELVIEEPDYLDQGVPAYRLIEQLLDGISNPTSRKMVEDFLSREVITRNLTKLSNGNYSLVSTSDMTNASQQNSNRQENYVLSNGIAKSKRRYSSENGDSGKEYTIITTRNIISHQFYDSCEVQNGVVSDLKSNTPKLLSQASSKPKILNKCEQNVVGAAKGTNSLDKNNTKSERMSREDDQMFDLAKKEPKSECTNLKRSSKSERKQRLMVRPDDSMDLEIKYDEYDLPEVSEKIKPQKDPDSENVSADEKEDEDTGRSSTNPSPTPSNHMTSFRSARRKRAKKVFDPSDNIVVKRRRGRQPGSGKSGSHSSQEFTETTTAVKPATKENISRQCSLCAKDKSEALIACRDCTVRAHSSCINATDEIVHKAGTAWQCERCKTCAVCCETSDVGHLVTCWNCSEAYHHSCHVPRIPAGKHHRNWQCSDCVQKGVTKGTSISSTNSINSSLVANPSLSSQTGNSSNQSLQTINSSSPTSDTPCNPSTQPPVLSPQVSPSRDLDDQMDEDPRDGIDPNIPDASDWTSEQVYQYFSRLFPKEAEVFRIQDIDGHSLLLMKRSDVLISLDLLLGPALKIYRHVLKLQMRRDDPRYYWL